MHLTKLEIQGFKTFAKKTVLTFLPPKDGRYPLTAIVGPNGSGKSNSADAIRWVLGEQSLKLLRGKQSDDVIFSGSDGKARAGFAEVSIELNNEDHGMPIDYAHVVITRRLYRDGTSEYLLNDSAVRLMDIQLLLAQANIGQRSYCVIGQGMVDHILVATPEERKAFFDDATGVKQFQIKRHEAMLKFKRTRENLVDVELVLKEIEPRLRSLKRQVSRLEERAEVEGTLRSLEQMYYGSLWWQLYDEIAVSKKQVSESTDKIAIVQTELKQLEEKTKLVEGTETRDEGLITLQKQYREGQKQRDEIRRVQFETEKNIELTKVRAQSNWAPLPLAMILEEVRSVVQGLKGLNGLKELEEIRTAIELILEKSSGLAKRLERPNPEDIKSDPELLSKLSAAREEEKILVEKLKSLEKEIDSFAVKEQKVRTDLIETQRTFRAKQQERHTLEQTRNGFEIELARLEERQHGLQREMDEYLSSGLVVESADKNMSTYIRTTRQPISLHTQESYPEIQRLRYKLELIGGIDPETIKEYNETKVRFEFLDSQISDLHKAMRATEHIIKELDEQIEKQSKKVFEEINKKFQHYFKLLFGGGSCELVKVIVDEENTEEENENAEGVDIQATPPGKRLKSLNLLSGGERALTSIALLSAIMDVNPSPFVMLDEVDAALDESNTIRFASILDELSQKSQFIIVTHNRATMEKADVLYGVTMSDGGISNLLSVHLEDIAQNGTARR